MILWFLLMSLVVIVVNIIIWILLYKWIRDLIEDFIHEKEYEYQRLVEDMEQERRYIKANMESLMVLYKQYLTRQDLMIQRLVNVVWKDFDEEAKKIIALYLQGYNINEIVMKLGVPKESVQFTLMVALGREGD